jgi:hypothetical protein
MISWGKSTDVHEIVKSQDPRGSVLSFLNTEEGRCLANRVAELLSASVLPHGSWGAMNLSGLKECSALTKEFGVTLTREAENFLLYISQNPSEPNQVLDFLAGEIIKTRRGDYDPSQISTYRDPCESLFEFNEKGKVPDNERIFFNRETRIAKPRK